MAATTPSRAIAVGLSGLEAEHLDALLARLDALPTVHGPAKLEPRHNNGTGRIIVNMWCRGSHTKASQKQPSVTLNKKPLTDPSAVPTFAVATERLITKIEDEHAGCLAAAEQAKAREQPGSGTRSERFAGSTARLSMHCSLAMLLDADSSGRAAQEYERSKATRSRLINLSIASLLCVGSQGAPR